MKQIEKLKITQLMHIAMASRSGGNAAQMCVKKTSGEWV
jgi:hypothetical protein